MTTWNPTSSTSLGWFHDGDTLYVLDGYVDRWYFEEQDSVTPWNAVSAGAAIWSASSLPATNWVSTTPPATVWL